jgi:starch synthase
VKILFVSSEVAPFAKTGGLGDVCGALPKYLADRGHDVRLVLPMYPRVREQDLFKESKTLPFRIELQLGGRRLAAAVHALDLPFAGRLTVYFIDCPQLFQRASIYGYDDEHVRFAFLNWAALALCQRLGFGPDIAHCNDWQTALIPLLLRSLFAWDKLFAQTRTVLTLHNVGHQGTFAASLLGETGLGQAQSLVHQEELGRGRFSFLLTGLLHAHRITTVSPSYAREIQREGLGAGLDPYLRARSESLVGILNGIDEQEWNPQTDKHLLRNYSAEDLRGKMKCKQAILESAGLPFYGHVPLVGVVARLAWQKGFDLCHNVLPRLLARRPFQLLVLGTGEPAHENFFRALAKRFPKQVAYRDAFSEPLAHQIEAGADFFLMPSRYEPCGLNQMYSLRYGTLPIVHKTGGLGDTVTQIGTSGSSGTGFLFEHHNDQGLRWALSAALDFFGSGNGKDRIRFEAAQQRAMAGKWGWPERVTDYEKVYAWARS